MDLQFIGIQAIGVLAWILIVLSYYRENTNKILVLQIISTILYCVHYYLLGAYSGLFICIFEVVRDYAYYKTDWDKYIFAGSIPVYLIMGYFSFTSYIDCLPVVSSLIDGYSLTGHKKMVVFGAVIEYALWVVYDIAVMSYSCAITDGLVAISNLSILIFNKSLFKNKKFNDIFCK